jgi:membrane protein involved in colicin uptake
MQELIMAIRNLFGLFLQIAKAVLGRIFAFLWMFLRPFAGKNPGIVFSIILHLLVFFIVSLWVGQQTGSPYTEVGVVMLEGEPVQGNIPPKQTTKKSQPKEKTKKLEEKKKLEEQKLLEEKKIEEQKKIDEEKKLQEQKKLEEEKKQKEIEEKKKLEEIKKKELEEKKKADEKMKELEKKLEAEKKKEQEEDPFKDLEKQLNSEASKEPKQSSGKTSSSKPDAKAGGNKASDKYSSKVSEYKKGMIKKQIEENVRTLQGRKEFAGMTSTFKIKIAADGTIDMSELQKGGRFDVSHPTYKVFVQEMQRAIDKTRKFKDISGEPIEVELEFGPFE